MQYMIPKKEYIYILYKTSWNRLQNISWWSNLFYPIYQRKTP